MSGIVGIYCLDGRPVDPELLTRMVEAIAHRGPDGQQCWINGSLGLGHRMLWTTPESLHERLPLRNGTGTLVITADARLDNRHELMAALDIPLHREISDSALILAAYEQWDERCPEKLLGDFAFALWDGRKQVLFGARDHLGVKPFYYYRSSRAFIFASEIKALLCLPGVPRRLNEVRVADYLVPMLEDHVITFYQDILRLPPAHTITVSPQGASVRPYWSLDPTREIRCSSDEEYAEAFRDIFTEAVRCRLRSAYPLGSTLSGGLDSSAVVCVARELLGDNGGRLHAFSLIYDDVPQCDERPYINAVLAQGGLDPHYVHGDRISPLADLERVLWHQDEAFYGGNHFLVWALCHAARQQGVRVLLDGFDGDTTVSHGIAHLTELARTRRWITLIKEVTGLSRHFNRSPWYILLQHAIKPVAPQPLRMVWRALRGRHRPAWSSNTIISPDFARRIGIAERFAALYKDRLKPAPTAREDHYRRLTSGLISFVLELIDRAAAAFALESRHPLVDKRLAEYCLALPPQQKLSRGWSRMVMRRALAGVLPAQVQWRGDKSNVAPNFTRGLLAFERGLLEEVILSDPKVIEAYVNVAALREVFHRYLSHKKDDDALTIWKAVTLALWLRHTGLISQSTSTNAGRINDNRGERYG